MKYNQPFGVSDPNAVYVNGNTAVGIEGSIPPAEGIEFDQREIVAVIKWAYDHGYHDYAAALCQAPSNADLTQLLKAIFGIMNSTRLVAPQIYYVNTGTGNDSFDGLTPSTAFKTLQKAANEATKFNLNGFSVTINVADGVYGPVFLTTVNGSGSIRFTGNIAVPANCRIHANVGPAVICIGGPYLFEGFRYESDAANAAAGLPGAGIYADANGSFKLGDTTSSNEFGNCADAHIMPWKGAITQVGIVRICGNASFHIWAAFGGSLISTGVPQVALIIPAAQTLTYFANIGSVGSAALHYSAITGGSNVTGAKYLVAGNSVLDSMGGGVNYLPGSIAGITTTGGQYL